ncbi:hypothetical protein HELRODRAFT_193595 [Helobdella robusta]|uniref:MATH domain-containing protein n=1 Tax=Helobdella robusta TaxID=6412 RepID=T1FV56_HELRO|nr:hypothetical protein HELRODRAFT_193595 [Helobdella robusta]ESN95238.1 hypothetical protein HELRODRAFT_193595 [Helobdella robusta]
MDLISFVNDLTDVDLKEGERRRKMNAFIKSYEINLIRKHQIKKQNLKNGLSIEEEEIEFKHGDTQTEEDESKIINHELQAVWKKVNECEINQVARMTSLTNVFRKTDDLMARVGKYCGTYQLLWKVRNFSNVLQEAKEGKKLMIQSPAFDSHRNGYKMQISLLPNGDSKDFESRDHFIVFSPSSNPANESFLKRPVEERNKNIGFQKFILLEDLMEGGFVQEDSIYVGAYVDIF